MDFFLQVKIMLLKTFWQAWPGLPAARPCLTPLTLGSWPPPWTTCPWGSAARGDYPGYVPLVTGGHLKISFLISYPESKKIQYCYRYMIIVIRKHTCKLPSILMTGYGLCCPDTCPPVTHNFLVLLF